MTRTNRNLLTTVAIATLVGLAPLAHAGDPNIGDLPEVTAPNPALAMEKVTYMGVTTRAVDADLQAQLKLPDGVGLVVTFVDAKGPSADDLKPGDVLQKLDDQILIDAHQLVTLVRMHHAGDSIKLSIIHQAQPATVTIKLGEKERPAMQLQTELQLSRAGALPDMPPLTFDYSLPGVPHSSVAMAFDDGTYSARVDSDKNGVKQLVVQDHHGKVVAQGPVDTEEQWQKIPADIRTHLEALHAMLFKKQRAMFMGPAGMGHLRAGVWTTRTF